MDYLITNGYPAAAKKFAVEANIQPRTDVESIQERVAIRTAIHSGNIQSAIEKINEFNPQVRFFTSFLPHFLSFPLAMIIPCFHAPLVKPLRGFDEKQTSSVLSMMQINAPMLFYQSWLQSNRTLTCLAD